jgi:urea carboxylase
VFGASYLVLGLGDVYLGAPVATPLDPRHRLVTTKYNPARTWTPENAVGIGGAYLCVYGMEGPGGYQFVGRTVQMWNRWFTTPDFPKPWLLRFFDRIRFYPVTTEELAVLRQDLPLGRTALKVEPGSFRWKEYQGFLRDIEAESASFAACQQTAFAQERERWKAAGLDSFQSEAPAAVSDLIEVPEGCVGVEVPYSGSLWQYAVAVGDRVAVGQDLLVVESMKMEITVAATQAGVIEALYSRPGEGVSPGQPLLALRIDA